MKKNIGLMLLVFLICFIPFGFCVTDYVPIYLGFPVYPPEEIEKIVTKQVMRFSVPLRFREYTLKEFEEINNKVRQFMSQPVGDIGRSDAQRRKLMEAERESLRKAELIMREFEEAQRYIKNNALKLRWQIINQGTFDDGSLYFVFEREKSGTVEVTIYSGTMMFTEIGMVVSPSDEWGKISYQFK